MSESKADKNPGENNKIEAAPTHFIKEFIEADLAAGKNDGRIATRFPPEPNGCIHIGHAKSILLNIGLAKQYGGTFNLRFDDTNPTTEETEFVDAIIADIKWLGGDWEDRLYFASDYFEKLHEFAVKLIEEGNAYVDDLTEEEAREYRGNFYNAAKPSPYRDRSVEENLDLFARMRAGEFDDGTKTLRAKADLTSPNMNMRDPIMYRIRRAHHHRTGDKWVIYPMYDFAHGQSDAIEGITHSICTLEFEDHRPLYDWYCEKIGFEKPPQQIEFARLNLTYTVMSKRRLRELVEEGHVNGWDDPRMPTVSGLRRRGYTPEAIQDFCERIGVAKADSTVDVALLEFCLREDLNKRAPRMMAVLDPLKVVIENFPETEAMDLDCPYLPEDFSIGSRTVPFTREIYVEREDFREDAHKKWHRLAPGKEVRLRYACLITCNEVVKDENGKVVELRCTWDPESKGGVSPDGRKVRGTLHWVSATHAIDAEVRLFDRLFTAENPMDVPEGKTFKDLINPDSLTVIKGAKLEPRLAESKPGDRMQFERLGYFCADSEDSKLGAPVFNRTVTLRDTWAKIAKQQPKPKQKKQGKKDEGGKYIKIDDFAKVELLVGTVVEAGLVEGADSLIRVLVDLGEEKPRNIFSGIRDAYPEPEKLVGTQVIVVANLKPRKMKFGVSEGMILAAGNGDDWRVLTVSDKRNPGDKVS
jgi:glutaminyl-tRNA synthetase